MTSYSSQLPCSRTERFAKPATVVWTRGEGHHVFDTPACRASSFNHRLEFDQPPTQETLDKWFDRWCAHHDGKGIGTRYLTFEVATPWVPFVLPDGVSFDPLTCLELERPMRERPVPSGYRIAPLVTDLDWAALRQLSEVVDEGVDEDDRVYMRWYQGGLRARVESDEGVWTGVWWDEVLVGAAGLFWSGADARFQAVQTHPDHRRRGVCSSMLWWLVEHMDGRTVGDPRRVYIAGTTDTAIERLYVSLGFRPCSWFYTLGSSL